MDTKKNKHIGNSFNDFLKDEGILEECQKKRLQSKTIHLTYYASLKEERGVSDEVIETPALTAEALYQELQNRHRFRLSIKSLKVAINDAFSSWQTELKSGDHVVFIPPVSGG